MNEVSEKALKSSRRFYIVWILSGSRGCPPLKVIPCINSIPPEAQDKKLAKKLWKERNAVVAELLWAAHNLIKNKYIFTPCEEADKIVNKWRYNKVSSVTSRPSVNPVPVNGLQVGNVIEHERFGVGNVLKVEGVGDNCKATVMFRHAGEKQLLLKFARFKVIG